MEDSIEKEENNEDENVLDMDDVITLIANKLSYTKSDVKEILVEGLIWIFEEAVKRNKIIKIRGLGKLYSQDIIIKGKDGEEPKKVKRHIFRLAKNIRFKDR